MDSYLGAKILTLFEFKIVAS